MHILLCTYYCTHTQGKVAQISSSVLEEHTTDAVVIAKVMALLQPCTDKFEDFHRLAKVIVLTLLLYS